ncbi:MAG: AMP-binding protein, partial [Candidatus Bipolaricaulia bacterium]
MNEEAMEANTLVVPFEAMCRKYPDRTAVVYLGTTFSYSKLEELIERFAAGLSRLGVKEGDKVLMYIPNCPQWLIAYFGIQRLGAVPVPTTPIYTPYELAYIANDAQAQSIVCADTNFGYVR